MLNAEQVMDRVLELARLYPDERYYDLKTVREYGAGYYLAYGKPSCLVGQAFAHAGITTTELAMVENKKASKALEILGFVSTKDQRDWLDAVQRQHDQNATYADAVEFANYKVYEVAA